MVINIIWLVLFVYTRALGEIFFFLKFLLRDKTGSQLGITWWLSRQYQVKIWVREPTLDAKMNFLFERSPVFKLFLHNFCQILRETKTCFVVVFIYEKTIYLLMFFIVLISFKYIRMDSLFLQTTAVIQLSFNLFTTITVVIL